MFDFIQGAAAAVLDRNESVTFWCDGGNLVTQVGYQKHSTPIADASSFERGCAVGANLANAYREQTASIRAAWKEKKEAAPAEENPTGAARDVRCRTPRVTGLNIATPEQPGERNNSASHGMQSATDRVAQIMAEERGAIATEVAAHWRAACEELRYELRKTHAQLRASLDREQEHIRDRQGLERKLATVRLAVATEDSGPACGGRNHDSTARRA